MDEPVLVDKYGKVKTEAIRIAKEESKLKIVEEGAENRGPVVDIFLRRAGVGEKILKDKTHTGLEWCGMFVYYCYSEAAKKYSLELPFGPLQIWSARKFRIWAEAKVKTVGIDAATSNMIIWDSKQKKEKDNKDIISVKAGDIFTIKEHHVGLVSADAENDVFESIEGNQNDMSNTNKCNGVINRTEKRRRHIKDCSLIIRI